MIALVEWLSTQGEMTFDAFVPAARAEGLDPANWRKAKIKGLLTTEIREGVLYIAPVAAEGEGE